MKKKKKVKKKKEVKITDRSGFVETAQEFKKHGKL